MQGPISLQTAPHVEAPWSVKKIKNSKLNQAKGIWRYPEPNFTWLKYISFSLVYDFYNLSGWVFNMQTCFSTPCYFISRLCVLLSLQILLSHKNTGLRGININIFWMIFFIFLDKRGEGGRGLEHFCCVTMKVNHPPYGSVIFLWSACYWQLIGGQFSIVPPFKYALFATKTMWSPKILHPSPTPFDVK